MAIQNIYSVSSSHYKTYTFCAGMRSQSWCRLLYAYYQTKFLYLFLWQNLMALVVKTHCIYKYPTTELYKCVVINGAIIFASEYMLLEMHYLKYQITGYSPISYFFSGFSFIKHSITNFV